MERIEHRRLAALAGPVSRVAAHIARAGVSRPLPAVALLAALASAVTLSGCSGWSDALAGDKVDYSKATAVSTLQVPTDLTKPQVDKQYVAPPVAAVKQGPQLSLTPDGGHTIGLPSPMDPLGMHVDVDRDQHWLVVDGRSPQELWPELKSFWSANGFNVIVDSPTTGVLETDWAENIAQLPNDPVRRLMGKFASKLYSTGKRDKFRMRVERTGNDGTAIFITHLGMSEVVVGAYGGDSTRWADRPRDPNLEVAFTTKLMQKFGLTDGQSKQLMAQARPASERVVRMAESNGTSVIVLSEPMDRAWLRVGLALDRSNFLVDNSDRQRGVFVVRYTDPVKSSERSTGLFAKMFGGKNGAQGEAFNVSLRAAANGGTQIAVLDANGQPDDSRTARRLVSMLQAQLS